MLSLGEPGSHYAKEEKKSVTKQHLLRDSISMTVRNTEKMDEWLPRGWGELTESGERQLMFTEFHFGVRKNSPELTLGEVL